MAQQPDATAALLQQALMAQQQQAANPNVNFQMQQMGQRQNLNQGAGVTAAIQQVNLSTILNQQLQQNQNQHQHQAGGSAANTPIDLHALMATLQQNNVNVGVAGVQRQHQAQPQTQQQHQLGGHAGVVQLENVSTAQLASSLMGNPNFTQVLNLHQQPQSMSNVGIPAVAAGPPGSAPSNVLRVLQLQQQKQQQQYHQQILSQNQQLPPGFGLSQQQSHQQIQQAAQMAQIALTAAAQTSPNAGSLPTPPSSAQALPNMPATTTVPAPQPASVGVISSPYSTFRTSPVESEHGCPHLYQLFIQSAPVHAGSAPGTKRSRKQDLMDDYASLVRFSLAWKYRSELRSGIEARGSFSSSGGLAPSAKRKRGDPEAVADAEEKASLAKVEKMLDKLKIPTCSTCSSSVPRIHACLECTAFGCWAPQKHGDPHIRAHMEHTGHTFAVDLANHSVYCRQCRDYVYDIELERVLAIERVSMAESVAFLLQSASNAGAPAPVKQETPLSPSASRSALMPLISSKRLRYSPPSLPTPASVQSIRQHFKLPQACPRGLRGLRNLGSTCFMNVVLQAVIHNPIMRNWWLGDGHNSRLCARGRGPGGICMACQVDGLYNQFYSGFRAPFGPSAFLHALWLSQSHLAGYAQQDAHEFFISLLNQLHMDLSSSGHAHSLNCRCIVHQTFGGVLQSEVRCEKCGNVTTAWDPTLDLSLELKAVGKHPSGSEDPSGALKLADCLDRFTHPERLSSGTYTCRNCGTSGPTAATKQMSVRTLPQVLSIQLKRFEHRMGSFISAPGKPAKVKGEGRKVDTQVRIPVHLDMEGYTSEGVRKRRIKSDAIQLTLPPSLNSPMMSPTQSSASLAAWAASGKPDDNEEEDPNKAHPDPGFQYTLFAVIEHIGKLDSGHYRAYVKSRGQWFAFDDHLVSPISQKAVLDCQIYMAYYVKDVFDFGEEPEAPKEKLSPLQQLLPPTTIVETNGNGTTTVIPAAHPLLGGQQRSPNALNRTGPLPPKLSMPHQPVISSPKQVLPSPMAAPSIATKTLPGGSGLNSFINMAPPPTGVFTSQPGTPRSPSTTPPNMPGKVLSGRNSPAPGAKSNGSSPYRQG